MDAFILLNIIMKRMINDANFEIYAELYYY